MEIIKVLGTLRVKELWQKQVHNCSEETFTIQGLKDSHEKLHPWTVPWEEIDHHE